MKIPAVPTSTRKPPKFLIREERIMIRKTFVINGVQRTMMVNENETLATFLRERLL